MSSVDPTTIDLTEGQSRVLSTLVTLYEAEHGTIKGKEIGSEIGRSPGTVRTQMQSLKALKLVEGIPGPKGGYVPTSAAYGVLDRPDSSEVVPVPFEHEGEAVDAAIVTEFDLVNLHHPDRHHAEVCLQGSIDGIHPEDHVTVGPTPAGGLLIEGVVDGVDESDKVLVLQIDRIELADAPVGS